MMELALTANPQDINRIKQDRNSVLFFGSQTASYILRSCISSSHNLIGLLRFWFVFSMKSLYHPLERKVCCFILRVWFFWKSEYCQNCERFIKALHLPKLMILWPNRHSTKPKTQIIEAQTIVVTVPVKNRRQ